MSVVLYVVRYKSLRRADHSSRGVLPILMCLSVIVKIRQWGGPGPRGAVSPTGGGGWGGVLSYEYRSCVHFINV
jgi:hypothetical protein